MCYHIDDLQFRVNLVVLPMTEFDVILGMDWLSSYHVNIDCFAKTICLRVPARAELVVATSRGNLLAKTFSAHIEGVLQRDQRDTLIKTRGIFEFEDIFQDIPSLSPMREVEFCIELQPGTAPISRAPYLMAPMEMRELHTQLEKLRAQFYSSESFTMGSIGFICEEERWYSSHVH